MPDNITKTLNASVIERARDSQPASEGAGRSLGANRSLGATGEEELSSAVERDKGGLWGFYGFVFRFVVSGGLNILDFFGVGKSVQRRY